MRYYSPREGASHTGYEIIEDSQKLNMFLRLTDLDKFRCYTQEDEVLYKK